MANKKFNFYASVNNNIARIVKTWTECEKIIAKPGGKKKGLTPTNKPKNACRS